MLKTEKVPFFCLSEHIKLYLTHLRHFCILCSDMVLTEVLNGMQND